MKKETIIFIHGVLGNSREYLPIINHLKGHGYSSLYGFSYEENFGTISLTELAKRFDVFIKELNKKDLVIIGLSQGGIIAAYWLEFLGGKEICKKCITICTPFYGSYLAYIAKLPGARELRPRSQLLRKIREAMKENDVDYYGIWNPFDLAVFPGIHAKMNIFKRGRRVNSALHNTTFHEEESLDFILEAVRDKEEKYKL